MFNNKKGLSTIVITIMLIAFVIIAAGLVWTVVLGLIHSSSGKIDINTKCGGVYLSINQVACAGPSCNVSIRRGGSEEAPLRGINVTLVGTNGNSLPNSYLFGPLNEGQTKTKAISTSGITLPVVSVEAIPYFKDSSGNDFPCPEVKKQVTA